MKDYTQAREFYDDGDVYMDFLYHLPELMAEPVTLKAFNDTLKRIYCADRLYGCHHIERVSYDAYSVEYRVYTLQDDDRFTAQQKAFAAYLLERLKSYLAAIDAVRVVRDDGFSVISADGKKAFISKKRESYLFDLKTPTGKTVSATLYLEPEGLACSTFALFGMTECKDLHDEIYGKGL